MKKRVKALACLLAASMLAVPTAAYAGFETEVTYVGTDGPVVATTGGDVLGYKVDGTYRFLGIPYATAGRFEEPQPISWENTYYALTYGTVCPVDSIDSINFTEFVTPSAVTNQLYNEDCQNLNIWTNSVDSSAKKPVIVWLHGGGFSNGSSTELKYYDGENLAKEGDVVFVSINHRLNMLGFLDLSEYGEEYANSGNLGTMDMVAALQWVHDNIEQFGGDPDNVTIIGQSGGGAKVTTLCALPAAQGLFQKAIVESTAHDDYAEGNNQETAREVAALTMENLGVTTVEELQNVEYAKLIAAGSEAIAAVKEEGSSYNWGPVVDGSYYPERSLVDGEFSEYGKDITMIVASVLGEMSGNSIQLSKGLGMPEMWQGSSLSEEEALAKLEETYGEQAQAIADAFLAAYPDHELGDALWVDTTFLEKSTEIVEAKAKQTEEGGAKVYQYVFAQDYACFGGVTPSHCAEIPYWTHNVEMIPELTYDRDEAYALEGILSTAYVNFAYTGDPSQDGLEWQNYTLEEPALMVFDTNSHLTSTEVYNLCDLMTGAGALTTDESKAAISNAAD
ncbi:MAG: carboxylesterase family protein [Eubacteriales bacterium]|nr:carboxylesterase family protein [Eubacteriales bacterium]